jgi:site-specific DNA-methyltransferase (adenine-specific)
VSARFFHRQRLGAVPAVAAPRLPRNTVLQGDCIKVMSTLPDGCVDLVLTDPPYICRYRDRHGRTVANDDNAAWVGPAFAEAYRVLRPGSFCISFYGWQAVGQFADAWRSAGFRLVGHFVFKKDYASSKGYTSAHHEQAYLLMKGNAALPASPVPDVLPWRYTGNRLHPTEKPVSSLTPLVTAYCPNGGLVLDPFCGSGSSLVAARESGRDWLGIEMDARYHDTAMARMRP